MGRRIITDCVLWLIATAICILWRLMAAKENVSAYILLFAVMMAVWVALGLLSRKYRSYRERWYWQEMLSMLFTGGCLMLLVWQVVPRLPWSLSEKVAMWQVGIVMMLDTVVILVKHYWKYACQMTVPPMQIEQRENAVVSRPDEQRTPESVETIHQTVLSLTTEEDYLMLLREARLDSRLTKIVANRDRFSFLSLQNYSYSTIVDLTLLNDAKGINKRFCIVNQKLPDNGLYVCCYRPQQYVKEKIMSEYPRGVNYIVYCAWFFWKRILPRLVLMSRLYYDLTKGRKRMLCKAEVLGRLYYCGFEVEKIVPMGHIDYVFARRHSQPYDQEQLKVYGPLIKLPRVCKNKEKVLFYKFRTMHPYSEYIQKYVFDRRGGMNIADKSDNDFRITTWGRFMRRYWIDELPMIWNWLKGDVKLVGVRPLSQTMFDTYPEWLQDKRTRCKPGLIPPFYIDHPKTFEELCQSESKYLDEYFEHPVKTDIKYFFLTMRSILFGRMHSA